MSILDRVRDAPAFISLSAARSLAFGAYAGWAGWRHNRGWLTTHYVIGITQLRDEAAKEAECMKLAGAVLKEREQATRMLVDVLDNALADYKAAE